MLSKSNFKIAQSCATKLYYAKNNYPKNTDANEYMAMLAEGGYMVGKLAQLLYPEGIEIKSDKGTEEALKETEELLNKHENITLFEAGISINNKIIRVDILRKFGNSFEIIEVKSKSVDSRIETKQIIQIKSQSAKNKIEPKKIRVKKSIKDKPYKEYLEDVAFQKIVLQEKFPLANISAFMLMPDKQFVSSLDNMLTWFKLVKTESESGAVFNNIEVNFTGSEENLKDLRKKENQLLLLIPVDEIIDPWLPKLKAISDTYIESIITNTKIPIPINYKCYNCEFKLKEGSVKNGFAECWGKLALSENEFILELAQLGNINEKRDNIINDLIELGKTAMADIPMYAVKRPDGKPFYSNRPFYQLTKKEEFLLNELKYEIEESNLKYPLHFIDFETSQMALPYHKNMRCFENVIFQWSCHTIETPGSKPKHYEWLNTETLYPNLEFAKQLKSCIGNEGSVMTWSKYENTQLKSILDTMLEMDNFDPELKIWLDGLIIDDDDDSVNRMIDMHYWAREFYFHPMMGGRTSIKVVLPAVLDSNKSSKITELLNDVGLYKKDSLGNTMNPYAILPEIKLELDGMKIKVKDGSGAMRAYQDMVYGLNRDNNEVKVKYKQALLEYCRLDTLAMVIIWEHWMKLLKK